jgi:hypothetical protein
MTQNHWLLEGIDLEFPYFSEISLAIAQARRRQNPG